MTIVSIWSVVALSLNLQAGMTGLINFGQILPFAVGAYAAGIASAHGLGWPVGLVAGLVAAPLVGLVVIFPTRRLAQDYWALVTLGAAEIFRLTMLNFRGIAGGVDGVSVDRLSERTARHGPVARAARGRVPGLRADQPLAARPPAARDPRGRDAGRDARPRPLPLPARGHGRWRGSWPARRACSTPTSSASSTRAGSGSIETFVIWTALIVGGPGATSAWSSARSSSS